MNWTEKKHLIIRFLACLSFLAVTFLVQAAEDVPVPKKKMNQHDVLPIVLLRCTACHGAQEQMGGLDLRTPEAMQKGGKSGPALIEGKPVSSRMIQRIEIRPVPPAVCC